jgi:hypothetical protein
MYLQINSDIFKIAYKYSNNTSFYILSGNTTYVCIEKSHKKNKIMSPE